MSKDKKKKKEKSLFDVAKELEEKRIAGEKSAEESAKLELQLEREEYQQRLRDDKIELIRLKQGSIEQSGKFIPTDTDAAVMPLSKKIINFFYHHWWWLSIAVIIFSIALILIYNYATREKPDITVLYIHSDGTLGNSGVLAEYISGFCTDYNNDGEKLAGVNVILYENGNTVDKTGGAETRLHTALESASSMIVITSDESDDALLPKINLVNLSRLFPDNKHIDEYRFRLNGINFAEKIGFTGEISDDMYISIRKIRDVQYDSIEDMREAYEESIVVLERIIEDLS